MEEKKKITHLETTKLVPYAWVKDDLTYQKNQWQKNKYFKISRESEHRVQKENFVEEIKRQRK